MSDKLSVPFAGQVYVRVTFTGPFPVDMLRRDECFPIRESDSRQIRASFDTTEPAVKRTVYLKRFCPDFELNDPLEKLWDVKGWKSFGIHVDLEAVKGSADVP